MAQCVPVRNRERTRANGKILYYSFLAGANQLFKYQEEINSINVFPVSDKDTGTNLAATVRSVIDSIKPHKSYKTTVNHIAEAALLGARGNSGVIFAQFLYGLSCETKDSAEIDIDDFAESVGRSVPYMYEAIANPVEGTMLTVVKEWSEYLTKKREKGLSFKKVLIDSLEVLDKSLTETTFKLQLLKKMEVVDAGAKGFVLFMKGVVDFIRVGNIRELSVLPSPTASFSHPDHHPVNGATGYRYCTEAMIKNRIIPQTDLQQILSRSGDSVVIAGSQATCRIHVHTNDPVQLFRELNGYGTITFQKVDDMIRQQEIASGRKWNIALVTDSSCDLSQELIDYYQINVLPLNLNFGDNHFLDKVTIQPDRFYDMLESEKVFPKTAQINEQMFTNLYSHLTLHYDAVIAIHLTGQFSGTFANSAKAGMRISKESNKPVYVIDSKNLSGGLGLLVLKAAERIEAGDTADAIVKMIYDDIRQTKIFVSVRDLKTMIRGGRVSKPKGFVASLLGVNPVVSMDEQGRSLLFGNTFSQQASLKLILKHIQKVTDGKQVWNYMVLHAHDPEGAGKTEKEMIELTGKPAVSVVDISPIIGMHAGLGAIAIALLINN